VPRQDRPPATVSGAGPVCGGWEVWAISAICSLQRDKAPLLALSTAWRWRLACFALAAGCLVLYLAGAGGYDLLTDDEIRYAEAGRQMLVNDAWIVPEYNGSPRYQKPILFYWLQALVQGLLGVSAWSARVPTALAGTVVVLLTAHLGRALWGERVGFWSGVALAVMVEVVLLARMVMTDVVLLAFLHGGLTCFALAQLTPDPARRRVRYRGMFLCLSLGVLTKGPIALVLPGLVIVPWLAVRGELRRALREARPLEGLAWLLVIAGPWYLLAHFCTGGEFTRTFLVEENIGRFTSTVNLHRQPALFYLLLLVPMTFPWTGILPQAIAAGLRHARSGHDFATAAPRFFVWQIVLVLLLFTFSQTKVWTYTLPLFPPLALLIGRWLVEQQDAERTRATAGRACSPLRGPFWLFAAVALTVALAVTLAPLTVLPVEVRTEELRDALAVGAWLLVGLSVLLVVLDARARFAVRLGTLVVGAAGWYIVMFALVVPAVDAVWNGPVRAVARHIRAHPEAFVITYHAHELGLNYHAGIRRVHHWRKGSLERIAAKLNTPQPVFVLVDPDRLPELAGCRFFVWGESRRFVYGANFPPGDLTP
jgi:4-amino-4-deoxy-L-arabinose transferase-like glycosyltransferase